MNRFLKVLVVILGVIFLMNIFGPREPVDWDISFRDAELGDNVDAYLQKTEAQFDDIIEGAEKEVIWAGSPGAVTTVSIVYIHGFSATKQEIRPVPDKIAAALGANLYFTRLTGHGRGGPAMTQATANDWLNDAAEAIAIGRSIGQEVIVLATSHGGTLTSMISLDPVLMQGVKGITFLSPNFGLANKMSGILTIPFARTIVPMVAGKERFWNAHNDEHAKWWTTRYPTVAVLPMAASLRTAAGLPFHEVKIPALFIFSPDDQVVRADAIRRTASLWGGPTETWEVELGDADDPSSHVLAGDILSPSMTEPVTEKILSWIASLES